MPIQEQGRAWAITQGQSSDDVCALADCGHELRLDAAGVEPIDEETADRSLTAGRVLVTLDRDEVTRQAHNLVGVDGDARHVRPAVTHFFPPVGESFCISPLSNAACAISRRRNFWILPDCVIGNSLITMT